MHSKFDYFKQLESPLLYLCSPIRKPIATVLAKDRHAVLRFNDLSELTFSVDKTEATESYYDLLETRRLLFLDNIGWFQIVDVNEEDTGKSKVKAITANSHQCILKDRGFEAEERAYMFYNPYDPYDERYDANQVGAMPSIVGQLYQQMGIKVALSSLDIAPTEDRGEWTITYIDDALKFQGKNYGDMYTPVDPDKDNMVRLFKKNSTNGYDFIINDVETAYEVVFEFDFLYHVIKVKPIDAITKESNIYLSFDNIVNSINYKENAENIVTVLSCNGGDLDIQTVNPMGTNYLVNFDYYMTDKSKDGKTEYPWMSKALIDAIGKWGKACDDKEEEFSDAVESYQKACVKQEDIDDDVQYANLKIKDLEKAQDQYRQGEYLVENIPEGTPEQPLVVSVETVADQANSMDAKSVFNKTVFDVNKSTIKGYLAQPTATQTEGGWTYSFSGEEKSGTPTALIIDYVGSETESEDGGAEALNTPMYFTDGDSASFCKLNIASEVGVVKDADGNISKEGTAEIGGKKFKITNFDVTHYSITRENGETIEEKISSGDYFNCDGLRFRLVASGDGIVSIYYFYVSGFDRFSSFDHLGGDSGWVQIWRDHLAYLNGEHDRLQGDIDDANNTLKDISEEVNIQKYIKKHNSECYDELLSYWIEGEYTNDNLAAQDDTTMSERIDLAKQLKAAGEKELAKVSQPTFEMTVDAINFIRLIEFRSFTDELELGQVITIEKEDGLRYYPALLSIEYDLDDAESFSLTFSNASKPNETAMTYADLIKEASSTSKSVEANWSQLTDYSRNKTQIQRMSEFPLDATLRATLANLNFQEFTIDTTGILGRKFTDDSHTSFSPEQVRMTNNVILFTKDNWETAATALGKVQMQDGEWTYGLVAETIVGDLILGNTLNIHDKGNTILLDGGGIMIKNGDGATVFQAKPDGTVTISPTGESGIVIKQGEEVVFQAKSTGDVLLKGTINASDGTIGGYIIGATDLYGNTYKEDGTIKNERYVGISSNTGEDAIAFWAGGSPQSAPFKVKSSGRLEAKQVALQDSITIGFFEVNLETMTCGTAFTIDKEGNLSIGGNLTIEKDFQAKTLKIGSITGRYDSNSAGFNFEQQSSSTENIRIKVSGVFNEAGRANDFGVIEAGKVTFTAETEDKSKVMKTNTRIDFEVGYHIREGITAKKKHSITIYSGKRTGTLSTAACITRHEADSIEGSASENQGYFMDYTRNGFPDDTVDQNSIHVLTNSVSQPSGEQSSATMSYGSIIPQANNKSNLGDNSHRWSQGHFEDIYIKGKSLYKILSDGKLV